MIDTHYHILWETSGERYASLKFDDYADAASYLSDWLWELFPSEGHDPDVLRNRMVDAVGQYIDGVDGVDWGLSFPADGPLCTILIPCSIDCLDASFN